MNGVPVRLACLDMAGTTVADDGLVDRAFLQALAAMGVGPDDPEGVRMLAFVRDTMGTSKIEVFRALFADEAAARSANAAFEAAFADLVRDGALGEVPGARATIDRLRAGGVRVALTTGFSVDTRDAVLGALGWTNAVDLALSPADAGRGRPFPDLVLTALLRLGIDAVDQVAVVGDTAADMTSGRRAGASVVAGVLTGADPRERLAAAGATAILESVREFPSLLGV